MNRFHSPLSARSMVGLCVLGTIVALPAPPANAPVRAGPFKDIAPTGDVLLARTRDASEVLVTSSFLLGDLNCDGRFNGGDIDPFFLAFGNPTLWQTTFPGCDILQGDINGDGVVDGRDIEPFFQCLVGNCP